MSRSFEHDVKALLREVMRRHPLRITSVWDDASFDNAMVTASGRGFRMRVIRDRGDVRIELAPVLDESWKNLQLIRRETLGLDEGQDVPLDELVRFFDQGYDRLSADYGRLLGSRSDQLKRLGRLIWQRLVHPGS